jgi:hypothetical protein
MLIMHHSSSVWHLGGMRLYCSRPPADRCREAKSNTASIEAEFYVEHQDTLFLSLPGYQATASGRPRQQTLSDTGV